LEAIYTTPVEFALPSFRITYKSDI